MVIGGLLFILIMVLVLPFAVTKVEENLEIFLFIMGILAAVISGIMNMGLILKALEEPVMIAAAVFIAGSLFFLLSQQFNNFMNKIFNIIPLPITIFLIIALLGLLSSVITAIVASIILVEIIFLLPLEREQKIIICILACFSIGLGAALTPIGEPLATIAISKLNQDFFYLLRLLGKFVIPGVVVVSLIGALYTVWILRPSENTTFTDWEEVENANNEIEEFRVEDTWRGIIVRALKVYLFVMALVFLGEGFQPLIDKYVLTLDYRILYWVNMISAVLDNATLTAAEISIQMSTMQIEAILMGLLISGGMLIPGNIPNIISASKLRITSTEWAKFGVPFGLVMMAVYFVILF